MCLLRIINNDFMYNVRQKYFTENHSIIVIKSVRLNRFSFQAYKAIDINNI